MKKEQLPHVGFAIIMIAFVYLAVKLLVHSVPLNLATWSMWVCIDTCLFIAMICSGNKRPWSVIGFLTGAGSITIIAVIKLAMGLGQWSWGGAEGLAAVCVVYALIVWKNTSGTCGVISITTAMYVAMIPTFIDQWNNPIGQDPWFWGACSLGCGLEFIGKPKTIKDAFFPACGAIANGVATLFSVRQFLL